MKTHSIKYRAGQLLAALVGAVSLTACAPPAYQAPLQDPLPGNPALETADAILRARANLPAMLAHAEEALRVAEVVARVDAIVLGLDPNGPELLRGAARIAYGEGRLEDGEQLFALAMEAAEPTADLYAEHAVLLVEAGQFARAREVAFDGLDRFPDSAELIAAEDRAIDEDPVLMPPIRTLRPDVDLDALKALGGGSTVTLRAVNGETTLAAIKPDQDLGQSMYRSEIAFYKLCEILRCSFRVPYNAHVRISRSDFDALYNRISSAKQSGYRSKFGHLRWKRESGGEFLHATWKEWVPDFTSFPVEATSAWQPWLKVNSKDDLSTPVTAWLPTLAGLAGPRGFTRHSERMQLAADLTMGQLIAQLSDQLAMDFLSNNWDRFSGDPELYGANCHLERTGLVAIDNGASFPPWNASRVERRLKYTQRFNRRFVQAVRRLDHDKTLERLFPAASGDEVKRFEIFWARRQELLDYVDELIATHGEDAVYLPEAGGP